ncbi:MaoC family dehydratase [Rhodococcus sp. IEGM 1307]|uniref:MaoC family dehydratase n=1 Tax=Rhodococcus sp. IEGM 1307 TaxID=3047091 RepID=UPI0024B75C82|nr:MaoC family dehydratase [Rhodococcus sp. IEGM 1307]MDI9977255.1 MaoC family dehydratase [Rhodococcus sp. IEGM 1307]
MTEHHDADSAILGAHGWFEDFRPGQKMRHSRAATVGELEGSGPAKQVMNTAQAHFNDHFLKGSPMGDERLVFGLATASLVYGLASQDTAEHAVAELGWSQLRFRAPVHHGDTISAFTEVQSVTPGDAPDAPGTVVFRHWGRNQNGDVVFQGERSTLMRRRASQSTAL